MNVLGFINEQMEFLSVPYELGEWTGKIRYPYFVGEITEEPPISEDGAEEFTLLVTGFHRGKFIDLDTVKEKIKKHFDPIYGLRAEIDGGSIAVFFDGSMYIPTGEAELKKIQINLKIKAWKGDF